MKKERKEINTLKSKLLTRDCCIYRNIENDLNQLPNKGLKFNYFKRQIDIRQGVKINAIFADREELIETASAYIKKHAKLYNYPISIKSRIMKSFTCSSCSMNMQCKNIGMK